MSTHTSCLAEACRRLGIPHSFVAGDENFLRVDLKRTYYFPGNSTPFNDESVAKICRDKEFTFKILDGLITVPKTIGFVDPEGPEIYRDYARAGSYEEIVQSICDTFSFPVIIKRNSGSEGKNVFLCPDRAAVVAAVSAVFQKESGYDHVILAQEYLSTREEYRVIVFHKEVILAYRKDNSEGVFTGNLSPLHWENSKAIIIEDAAVLESFRKFIAPLYERLNLGFGGLDIVLDQSGELRLIELNSRPGFSYFVRDNGRAPLIAMYARILTTLRATG